MAEAVVWYKSKIILTQLAGIILLVAGYLGYVPVGIDQEKLGNILLLASPYIAGIVTRVFSRRTSPVKLTKASAEAHNLDQSYS